MASGGMSWLIIDEREGSGRLDTWSEYLCVSRTSDPKHCDVAICRHEVIAELPREWFDDDWQPLPEYADAEGNLALPSHYDVGGYHAKITGYDGEYLLGELALDEQFGGPIDVALGDVEGLSSALDDLGWRSSDVEKTCQAIQSAILKGS